MFEKRFWSDLRLLSSGRAFVFQKVLDYISSVDAFRGFIEYIAIKMRKK